MGRAAASFAELVHSDGSLVAAGGRGGGTVLSAMAFDVFLEKASLGQAHPVNSATTMAHRGCHLPVRAAFPSSSFRARLSSRISPETETVHLAVLQIDQSSGKSLNPKLMYEKYRNS